ncbi:MAG: metal-sensitive transcriptional regulator [Oscillospiraceae bacterium]
MEHINSTDVTRRLSRIEGQVRGINEMVRSGRECEDIMVQLSSVNSAITQVAKIILTEHLEHCVVKGIKSGDEDGTVASLKKVVSQFAKMK